MGEVSLCLHSTAACATRSCAKKTYSEDIGEYVAFGIECTDEEGRRIALCADISTDGELVESLCNAFNNGNLSPLHFADVIEDVI